ncbi:MAG: hypothetical protein ABIH88_02685 [Patescibacteria group bacterium]|nr:hypothetical protein [Patescibacteria group bacterium]
MPRVETDNNNVDRDDSPDVPERRGGGRDKDEKKRAEEIRKKREKAKNSLKDALQGKGGFLGIFKSKETFGDFEKRASDARWAKDKAEEMVQSAVSDSAKQTALEKQALAASDLEKLERNRQKLFSLAKEAGLVDDLDAKISLIKEGGPNVFIPDLLEAAQQRIEDTPDVPKGLEGLREVYFIEEVTKLVKAISPENLSEQDKQAQFDYVRKELVSLGVANLPEDDFKNNLAWVRLRSLVLGFDREVVEEFRARVDVAMYAGHYRRQTSLKEAVRGNDGVTTSKIARLLEIKEISKAVDLLEESSDITENNLRQDQKLAEENILFAGSGEQREVVYNKIAERLARSFREDLSGANKGEIIEKYRKYVDEAANAWWLLGRPEEKGESLPGGVLVFAARLLHFETRAKKKLHGTPEIRARFFAPWLRIRDEKGKLKDGKARGLGVNSFTFFTFDRFKKEDLLDMGFSSDRETNGSDKIEEGRDGNGGKFSYMTFRHGSGENEAVARYALKWDKDNSSWRHSSCIEVSKISAEVMAKALKKAPENGLQSYSGLMMAVDGTREKLEEAAGALNTPLGSIEDVSEEDIFRRISRLKGEIFGHLDSMAQGRNPGEYHREDAWKDLIQGSIQHGLSKDGRKTHEQTWGEWRARRVDIILKAAIRAEVITKEHERMIVTETLGGLPNKELRKRFGPNASEKPVISTVMKVISSVDRWAGKNLDIPLGLLRNKNFRKFALWSAIFGVISEFWNGLKEGLPGGGGGGGSSRKRR